MADEPIKKDQARTDGRSSSYRMTSFLVLSSGRTKPVGEDQVPPEAADQPPEAAASPPERKIKRTTFWLLLVTDRKRRAAFRDQVVGTLLWPLEVVASVVERLLGSVRDMMLAAFYLAVIRPVENVATFATRRWSKLKTDALQEVEPEALVDEASADEMARAPHAPVSFVDLYHLNVTFTDNYNAPLYDFGGTGKTQRYGFSKSIVDPIATERAMVAIAECGPRAVGIPPATEGLFAGMPVSEVLTAVTEEALQGFLRYVKAYPGNYIGRNLKISETFATWVVYGAPAPEDEG